SSRSSIALTTSWTESICCAASTFRYGDQIVKTPDRPFIENLDELPRPSYKSIPIERYRICGKKFLPIMSSRGCPFQCAFCVASQMFGAKFRARSPKNVVDEMEWLINTYGAEGISFHDDTLTLDKKRTFDICDEIISRKLKIAWGCQTRVDQVSKEVLSKMRRAGCNEVSFGVESGCQRILDAVKKKVSTEQSAKAVKIAKEEGLFVAVSTIIGYPGETKESLKQTLDFIHTLEPDDVWLCLATPYPGTELRALIERMGWKMVTDWTLYNTMNPIFENPDLPSEEISMMRKQFYDKFYSPRYVIRQMIKGYVKGNFYSKIMARTSANYLLWRIKSRM
ncbi:MAG: radical SAM protein, partial [Candidatus Bathyarchaeia archaeon]